MGDEEKLSEGHNSVIEVSKQYKNGSRVVEDDTESEILAVHRFPEGVNPAHVGFNASITVNLGNYESVKVGVLVSLPAYPEEIDDAFVAARNWVMPRLLKEKKMAEEKLKGRR